MILNRRRLISYIIIAASVIISTVSLLYKCSSEVTDLDEQMEVVIPSEYMYGICIDSMNILSGEVSSGESFSALLTKYGISGKDIDALVRKSKDVFDLRTMRMGKSYNVLITKDSTAVPLYFVYEHTVKDYVVFSLQDSLYVKKETKPITIERRRLEATITSSLWNAIAEKGISLYLSEKMENVFQWSVDFYGIQEGDSFNVIYDEEFIEDKSVGIGTIYGAWFETGGKRHVAVRYEQGNEVGYWDADGKSAKKAFLKAPLNFSRISSKFTASRLHPVLRIRRPHFGVDYAAPSGTPVRAIGSGTVIMKAYSGGGGNTIKIQHSGGYTSGYLHLKGYAKGLTKGKKVAQGEIIGYVGSTGLSTGPHLDFRIWKGGKPIDPLKIGQEPGLPISKAHLESFFKVRDRIVAELEGAPYIPMDSLVVDTLAVTVPTK